MSPCAYAGSRISIALGLWIATTGKAPAYFCCSLRAGPSVLAGDPAALRFLDLVDISLDPLDEGRRMRTLTNRVDMHGVEMFRS